MTDKLEQGVLGHCIVADGEAWLQLQRRALSCPCFCVYVFLEYLGISEIESLAERAVKDSEG